MASIDISEMPTDVILSCPKLLELLGEDVSSEVNQNTSEIIKLQTEIQKLHESSIQIITRAINGDPPPPSEEVKISEYFCKVFKDMYEMSKDIVKGTTKGFANVSVTSYRKKDSFDTQNYFIWFQNGSGDKSTPLTTQDSINEKSIQMELAQILKLTGANTYINTHRFNELCKYLELPEFETDCIAIKFNVKCPIIPSGIFNKDMIEKIIAKVSPPTV